MKDIKGCPYHQKIANEFQPFDLSNPYPFYQKAREEAPIFYNPELKYWVVTRYAEIKEIFTNWKVFLSDNAQVPLRPILPKAKAIMEAVIWLVYRDFLDASRPTTRAFDGLRVWH